MNVLFLPSVSYENNELFDNKDRACTMICLIVWSLLLLRLDK